MFRKSLCCILTFVILISVLSGCSNNSDKNYDKKTAAKSISSQNVAENNEYILSWNDETKCIILQCKQSGKYWSTTPYEYMLEGGSSDSLNSAISLQLATDSSTEFEEVRGYSGAVEEGRVFSEKTNNGICVTYYFDKYEISIPVVYTLQNNGLSVSIDGKNIVESGAEWKLVSVSFSPYLCSARTDSKDSYLLVPSGCGALMYTNQTAEKTRKFSGEVYGEEESRYLQEDLTDDEAIRLPVFGVKAADHALLGIISENSIAAEINAESGNNRTGYSHIWPSFYFRGYDIVAPNVNSGIVGKSDIIRISEDLSKGKAEVLFCPLMGENADYIGMANAYRSYLEENGLLTKTDEKQAVYGISLIGGLPVTSSFAGIPYQTVKSVTTFDEAKDIVSELKKNTNINPVVKLLGYGNNGILPGKVAGGYKFNSVFGGSSSQKALEEFCTKCDIRLFTDFDIVRYNSSGSGFGYSNAVAKTAIGKSAEGFEISASLHTYEEDYVYHLLGRENLFSAVEKLNSKFKKMNISGVSLGTLTSMSYSDFDNEKTYVKGNMAADVRKLIDIIKSEKHTVASSAANAYAACVADVLFDTPTNNGSYYSFDEQIPFYQMVFKGIKPLYSEPINISSNTDREIALALSGGVGLQFSLIKNYDAEYKTVDKNSLYAMLYDSQNKKISKIVSKYSEIYNKIGNATIIGYKNFENGISETIFDNGIKLYVNHTNTDIQSSVGVLSPYSAKYVS